jgi:hypothetical protein
MHECGTSGAIFQPSMNTTHQHNVTSAHRQRQPRSSSYINAVSAALLSRCTTRCPIGHEHESTAARRYDRMVLTRAFKVSASAPENCWGTPTVELRGTLPPVSAQGASFHEYHRDKAETFLRETLREQSQKIHIASRLLMLSKVYGPTSLISVNKFVLTMTKWAGTPPLSA